MRGRSQKSPGGYAANHRNSKIPLAGDKHQRYLLPELGKNQCNAINESLTKGEAVDRRNTTPHHISVATLAVTTRQ